MQLKNLFLSEFLSHVNGDCSSLRFSGAGVSVKMRRPRGLVLQPSGIPAMLSVAARGSVPWIWVGRSLFTSWDFTQYLELSHCDFHGIVETREFS